MSEDWTAYYMPAESEVTVSGFETKEVAIEHVKKTIGKPGETKTWDKHGWFVLRTEDFKNATSLADIVKKGEQWQRQ